MTIQGRLIGRLSITTPPPGPLLPSPPYRVRRRMQCCPFLSRAFHEHVAVAVAEYQHADVTESEWRRGWRGQKRRVSVVVTVVIVLAVSFDRYGRERQNYPRGLAGFHFCRHRQVSGVLRHVPGKRRRFLA